MKRTRGFCVIFILLFSYVSVAQTVEIRGKVIVDDEDIEGIHVINKSSSRFTITSSNGDFTIPGKHNDTIIFSAIKYKPKEVIIDAAIINSKMLNIYLSELVNELNQVILGKILTGNLLSDVENSEAKRDINFYDLGIPGYTGKPFTQAQRRYNEATTGGGIVPLNPILNYFSGRTKMLKNQMKLESLNECLETIKSNLSELFFEYNDLPEANRKEFFYYCLEDDEFSTICQIKNEIRTLEFLNNKLESYNANLQEKKQ